MKSINETWEKLPTPSLLTGPGSTKETPSLINKLGAKKVLMVMINGPEIDLFNTYLKPNLNAAEGISWTLFDKVEPDPSIRIIEEGVAMAKAEKIDVVIALGGGSSIDAAKVIAALANSDQKVDDIIGEDKITGSPLPLIAIPTTAGTGSEVTHIAILSDERDQLKKGITSPKIIPAYSILDPILTISKPPSLTANTGLDALSHAVEAFTSVNATLLTNVFAREAITLILGNIRIAYTDGKNVEARYRMLLGSHLAGIAFSNAGVTAAHALAYPLGARYHISHGASVMLLLSSVLEYNCAGNEELFKQLSSLFTGKPAEECQPVDVINELNALCETLNMPANLEAVDVDETLIPEFSESALKVVRLLRNNPRPITDTEDTRWIYERAYRYDRNKPLEPVLFAHVLDSSWHAKTKPIAPVKHEHSTRETS